MKGGSLWWLLLRAPATATNVPIKLGLGPTDLVSSRVSRNGTEAWLGGCVGYPWA